MELYNFDPQVVFLAVFSGVVIVAYVVNRLHGVNVVGNKNETH